MQLDPVAAEAFDIPCSFESFHHQELCEFGNEALALDVYQEWLDAGGQPPGRTECVGYIKPLLLGGKDESANQEITDMEVYWSICSQIKQQIDALPDDTRIDAIDLE